ncbi:MAG: LptF/LptG family permease [Elusimicrobiota bacterium]
MKTLQRYIIREFAESFLFGLLIFSIILLLDQIFQLIDLIISKGVPVLTAGKLFLLIMPNIMSLTIPMAVLLAILLSYGRLSEDNEITAMRSSGLGYLSFTAPILIIVAVLSVLMIYFNQNLTPSTNRQFRQMYKDVLAQRPLVKFEDNSITSIGEYKIYVKEVDKRTDRLLGVNIYRFSAEDTDAPWRITASSAIVSAGAQSVVFCLYRGFWQKPNPSKPENLVHLNFIKYIFSIPMGGQILPISQSLHELTGKELLNEISAYRSKKLPTNFLETQYWLRWALAFAPLVMALVGIPLGIVLERGGKSIGFGVSLALIFAYYILLVIGLNFGEKGLLRPGVILWLPDAALLGTGVWLWKRMLGK